MLSEFESNIASFKREMIPIMAQAVVAKRHDSSISLSDFKISKIVAYTLTCAMVILHFKYTWMIGFQKNGNYPRKI